MQTNRLLTLKQLKENKGVPYSREHLYRLEKSGKFPKRIRVGPNRIAWDESEVDAWLEERRQARDGTEAA